MPADRWIDRAAGRAAAERAIDDIAVENGWRNLVLSGKISAAEYLRNVAQSGRDNARTPMQWDASIHAGFTKSAKPWLAVNPNDAQVNVEAESR